jgi:hypothetical protein
MMDYDVDYFFFNTNDGSRGYRTKVFHTFRHSRVSGFRASVCLKYSVPTDGTYAQEFHCLRKTISFARIVPQRCSDTLLIYSTRSRRDQMLVEKN